MGNLEAWIADELGRTVEAKSELPGGAGARRYWRIHLAGGTTAILMHALPEDLKILPPALRENPVAIPFVAVSALLQSHGVPVPEIFAVQEDERYVLLEDCSDRSIYSLAASARAPYLKQAIECLAHIHAIERSDHFVFRRHFDLAWIEFEMRHFLDHGVAKRYRAALTETLTEMSHAIAERTQVLCMRDYQSQNLMIDPTDRLRILDFQDALLAPRELDLAAFLFDSYIDLTADTRNALLHRYEVEAGVAILAEDLALLVTQRKCKDFARFHYLMKEKGDSRFVPFAASARKAVLESLALLPNTWSDPLARGFESIPA